VFGSFALLLSLAATAQPTLPSGAYTYDGAGNITAIGSNTYSYDALGRLTKAVVVSGGLTHTQEFTYDAYGNMTSTKTDGALVNIGIDANTNRLTDVVTNAYDEAGNLRIDGAFQYTYDSLGQMSEKVAPSVHEYYVYDANDERVAVRTAPDNWQITFRDLDGKPLRSFRGSELNNWSQSWTWVQDWVWRDGQLLGSEHPPTDGGRQHYHLDHLGTPRLATTTNGVAVARHDYYPYGVEITPLRQETAAGFSQEQAMKFTGHERDFTGGTAVENTNYLDYMHARTYSSAWGRFLSVDSAQNVSKAAMYPQAWNRYVYSRNNPLILLDPDGRDDKDFRVVTVRINVVYSNADLKINKRGQTLRQVTEQGIAYSRSFFADAKIKLDVHRYEGTINAQAWGNINGPVKTPAGDVQLTDFTKSQKGALNVLVSGDLGATTGLTAGVGGPTMIGNGSDKMVFNDEMSHALGNVTFVNIPLVSNTLADLRLDVQETFVEHGWGMSPWYRDTFRDTVATINGETHP
jgi:RHS repeat-associated protein